MTKYILNRWELKKLLVLTKISLYLSCKNPHDPYTGLIIDNMDAIYEFLNLSEFEEKLIYKNFTYLKAMLGV